MEVFRRALGLAVCLALLVGVPEARGQVNTGSITGAVSDTSGAVLPGVNVTVSGERLIGGAQVQVTDAAGAYRFDRLPPGAYQLKFELAGFRTVERTDVRMSAAFVATINARMEVGALAESITVTGESPTVDVRSNVQQTVMSQEILEGVPTGRDPWSLAKIIPGVQVSTYDVGGTQSMQQSSMSSHGSSTNDVSYNIDGATVNWPGGGGGATMMYYDQGMFEEVNYMTSAIPAEVLAGGVSINMVTKAGGNMWRGNLRYNFANDSLQSENFADTQAANPNFLGNPTKKTYDFNVSGGGAIVQNRMWVNGTVRKWVVNKLVNSLNADGSQALDDNDLKNYSGKLVTQLTTNNKVAVSYLWNDKIRGHRRDSNDRIPDIASLVQTNPVQTTQVKYTGIRNRLVFESNFSIMDGQTNYLYQPDTPADAIRKVDDTAGEIFFAATREEHQPNSRHQFDNVFSYSASAKGDHLFKFGVQWGRLYYESQYSVRGDHYVEFRDGVPLQIRQFNTPVNPKNVAKVLGVFFQDSWTMNRLTLNIGARWDRYVGTLPEQSNPAGRFSDAQSISDTEVINQNRGVWRLGAAYDLTGSGQTALKASYSRYGLQVGIDRVTSVNPLSNGSRLCPWSDPNGDGRFQEAEVNPAQCGAFSGGVGFNYAPGIAWPYSDEVTAGIETQLPGAVRVGAMFYYRTNRDQIGQRNVAVPTSAYTPFTVSVPDGPNGATEVTVYNLAREFVSANETVRNNEPFLDTDYKGIEFTATKRFSRAWQMQAGLTIGNNRGGINTPTGTTGQSSTADLNDPNLTTYTDGIVGSDSTVAFRLSGSYLLPGEINLAGSMVANDGYPFISTYSVSRALASGAGVSLTRSSQTTFLSERGEERYPSVTMFDIRLSRAFSLGGGRSITSQFDFFNITNADTIVAANNSVGSTYLQPQEILSPRILRVGFSLNF